MKLIFLSDIGTAFGGGGYALYLYAEYLARRGHKVQIFGLNKDNKFLSGRKIPKNLKLHDRIYFPRGFKGGGRIDNILHSLYTHTYVKRFIKKHNYDFICGSLRVSAINGVSLARNEKIKSVSFVYETPPWMEHDLGRRWFEEYHGRFKKSWQQTKQAYLESDVLISISMLSKEWCEKWLENKKVDGYSYPGIELDNIAKIETTSKKNQIVYVGRLHRYKNIDLIIKALSKIKNPPKLVIVGKGWQENYLKKLAQELHVKTKFLGRITDKEKWKHLKESLFMVFPTSHEGFGMPPMEALACEIPCICTNKPILKEVYENKVEFFKDMDVENLTNKIKYLIKNSKYRTKRGKEGRAFIEKKFSWKKSAKEIEKILDRRLKNGN